MLCFWLVALLVEAHWIIRHHAIHEFNTCSVGKWMALVVLCNLELQSVCNSRAQAIQNIYDVLDYNIKGNLIHNYKHIFFEYLRQKGSRQLYFPHCTWIKCLIKCVIKSSPQILHEKHALTWKGQRGVSESFRYSFLDYIWCIFHLDA